jgi:peptidoglycan/xylan/chitin deacetylase (PgdA/CDA1 family)
MSVKILFKRILASIAWSSGILKQLADYRLRDQGFVLMYHRVLKKPDENNIFVQPGMYVSAESFQRQIYFLKKRFKIIFLSDMLNRVKQGLKVGQCCALTFDDGWLDNYSQAFPILNEIQAPATIFLSSGYIGTCRIFWPEELATYLQNPKLINIAGKYSLIKRFLDEVPVNLCKNVCIEKAVSAAKKYSQQHREDLLSCFRDSLPIINNNRMIMNWEEVREMKSSGNITFAAHTVNHVILDQISLSMAEEEIVVSREEVKKKLGQCEKIFSYPNGNYNRELQSILERHGFQGAVTAKKGLVGKKTPLFEIPRIGVHEDVSSTRAQFYLRIISDRF